MDSTHAAETTTTPPIAKYHHEETPADGEKGSSVAGFSDSSEGFREEERRPRAEVISTYFV